MNTDLKKLIIVGTGTNAKHVYKLVKFYDLFDVIGFAVDLSYCDFSGTREDIRDPEALALWERYLPDAVFTYYLKGALAEKPWNMNHYDFGTGAVAKYFHEIATNPCPVSSISLRPRNVY